MFFLLSIAVLYVFAFACFYNKCLQFECFKCTNALFFRSRCVQTSQWDSKCYCSVGKVSFFASSTAKRQQYKKCINKEETWRVIKRDSFVGFLRTDSMGTVLHMPFCCSLTVIVLCARSIMVLIRAFRQFREGCCLICMKQHRVRGRKRQRGKTEKLLANTHQYSINSKPFTRGRYHQHNFASPFFSLRRLLRSSNTFGFLSLRFGGFLFAFSWYIFNVLLDIFIINK